MDIHIRFLEDGCVRSRYFGPQILGYGRADDLLQHIKVSLLSYTYWLHRKHCLHFNIFMDFDHFIYLAYC